MDSSSFIDSYMSHETHTAGPGHLDSDYLDSMYDPVLVWFFKNSP